LTDITGPFLSANLCAAVRSHQLTSDHPTIQPCHDRTFEPSGLRPAGLELDEERRSASIVVAVSLREAEIVGAHMIYVVMPVKNRLSFTRQCLADLAVQGHTNVTTIVVDDGSSDGTAEVLAREFPPVVVLSGAGDLWWTRATNLGVTWALNRAADADYVLTLNNDTRCAGDYLSGLLAAASHYRPALVGSLAVDHRGLVVDGGVRVNWPTAKFELLGRGLAATDLALRRPSPVTVDVLPGRGTLIPVEAFRAVGLFDAVSLPHYGADYEFSRRAASHGYRLLVSYDALLQVRPDETGLHGSHGLRSFVGGFTSRRSANNLLYRWRFARAACPRRYFLPYVAFDTARVVVGSFRRQVLQRG
jgi:glycosyltransferase involved in cell wall biosynthesis